MLASKRTGKERYLHCHLLIRWLVTLLKVLLVSLLEVLLDCCILLDVAKTLVTSTYNILKTNEAYFSEFTPMERLLRASPTDMESPS